MIFRQLYDIDTGTWTYLLADSKSGDAIIIDPVLEQLDRDFQLIGELGLNLKYSIETHIHADHITSAHGLREKTGCKIIIPHNSEAKNADGDIKDGESFGMGEFSLIAIATPGHTDHHLAYLLTGLCVFTGDALLIRGCGRTDFQSGDAETLYDSITQKLFTLTVSTLIYPGHDYKGLCLSTLAEEKRLNPRLAGKSKEEFIEIMNNLNLPYPKRIDQAVPANLRCGKPNQ